MNRGRTQMRRNAFHVPIVIFKSLLDIFIFLIDNLARLRVSAISSFRAGRVRYTNPQNHTLASKVEFVLRKKSRLTAIILRELIRTSIQQLPSLARRLV